MSSVLVLLLVLVGILAAALGFLLVERARLARAHAIAQASEDRLRQILDRVPFMIWTARPDSTLDYVNHSCSTFTGLPIEKLRDEGWLDAVHAEDRARCMSTYLPAFDARVPFHVEYRMRRADGTYRWVLATGSPKFAPDGSFSGYIGGDVDITGHKDDQDRIRTGQLALEANHREIQHLAGRLIAGQDAERARIARDLHDDVSQQLAGLSIALSGLRRRMDELHLGEDVRAELRALHERATTLAQNVRHLSHDLHPTVLRHAGLGAALTSHCAELERAHGIRMTCSAQGDIASIDAEVALCLYRIAQEALRNAIAHAAADRVDVRLVRSGEHAELTIEDDGRGFDVARSFEAEKGLGLVSIAERAKLAGGAVRIVAEPNRGTRVLARIPAPVKKEIELGIDLEVVQREPSFS